MTAINLNLRILTQALIFMMSFNALLRGALGSFYGLIELLYLSIIFVLSLFYFVDKKEYYKIDYARFFYLSFLVYLITHLIIGIITRSLEYDVSSYSFILIGLYEFKNSSITFLFPLIYFAINNNNKIKYEYFLILILKIAVIYTIFEQIGSLLGYREFFISYMQGVIYEIHNANATRLGMYRPYGLIGSPHLLGVLHVIGVIYMFHYKQYKWAFISLIGVYMSTSITAYGIMAIIFALYFVYSKKYIWILIGAILSAFFLLYALDRLDYILGISHLDEYADASPLDLFIHQIYGYFLLISNIVDPVSHMVHDTGPLNSLINYFSENPLNIIFGKGMTYLMELRHYDLVQIHNYGIFFREYGVISSDFYLLNFFEQFGILGIIFLITIFFIVPLLKLNAENRHHVFILNAFLISTLHYAPTSFFILMMLVGYSVYSLYFMEGQKRNE